MQKGKKKKKLAPIKVIVRSNVRTELLMHCAVLVAVLHKLAVEIDI